MCCDKETTDNRKISSGFEKYFNVFDIALFKNLELDMIDQVCISQMENNLIYWGGKSEKVCQCDILSVKLENMPSQDFAE